VYCKEHEDVRAAHSVETRLTESHIGTGPRVPAFADFAHGVVGLVRVARPVICGYRAVERYWRIMLSSRSWKGQVLWKQFQQIKERFPIVRPKLYLPYSELQAIAVL
jgi:hypothetical protein